MAMNQFLNNVKKHTINATDKIKDGITETASKTGIYDVNKQKMKSLIAEKAKMYEFIGMEIFDLYEAGKVEISSIEPFCKKIIGLNAELALLENATIQNEHLCECGAKLHEEMKFCAVCGKKVSAFDPIKPSVTETPVIEYTQCVCGAEVEVGSPMCMECGRRIAI